MAEIWDLYDKDKNLIGKTHERGKPLSNGEYNLVVEVWVVNDKRQILLTRRHPSKFHGDLWEAPGGAVTVGEESITGAKRELFEETGIDSGDALSLLGTLVKRDWIVDMYILKKNISIDQLRLQKEEVTDAKWVSITEFEEMCSKKMITPVCEEDFNIYREKMLKYLEMD